MRHFLSRVRLGVCFIAIAMIGAGALYQAVAHAQEKARTDAGGDALPQGALARLGSLRWRHGETISFVAFNADGKSVFTASQDNIIRLWDRATGKEIRRFTGAPPAGQPLPGGAFRVNTLRGSPGIALSPDGKTLASVRAGNVIQLWDTATGKELRTLKSPPNGIACVLFSPDSKTLAVRSTNRTIHLMDVEKGNEIRQLQVAPKQKAGVAVFVIGFQTFGEASAIAFSPDGKTIASSDTLYDNRKVTSSVKFFNIADGKVDRTIESANQGINAIAYSHDGKTVAYSNLNSIKLLEADTGKEIRNINSNGASMLVFSPDDKSLAARGRDQVTRLFTVETGKQAHQFGEGPAPVNGNQAVFVNYNTPDLRDIAFSPDGQALAVGNGHVLRFFEVGAGKELPMAGGHRGPVTAVIASADGKSILSRGGDNVVRRWDALTGKELAQFDAPKGTTTAAFSADLTRAAFGTSAATMNIYDVTTGKQLHQLKGHVNGTAAIEFSPDGTKLASRGNVDQTIRIFDVAKGKELRQISLQSEAPAGPNQQVIIRGGMVAGAAGLALAFSADGQSIAANIVPGNVSYRIINGVAQPVGGQGNSLRVWDVTTGKETRKIEVPIQQRVVNLAFSPDGRVIATENSDQTVTLWEVTAGRKRGQLGNATKVAGSPSTGMVIGGGFVGYPYNQQSLRGAFALSSDGELVAVMAPNNSIRVWDVYAGKEIGLFKGHQGAITSLAFAPNSKTLISGSNDTTILVWDVAGLKRDPRSSPVDLTAKEVESLWNDLTNDDGTKASQSIGKLSGAGKPVVAFLTERLQPAVPVDQQKIDKWIVELDSTNFKKRGNAAIELEKLGELSVPALKKVLKSPVSLETRRRIEPMLERLTGNVLTNEQIRQARAIEILEKIGNPEARSLLEALAKGAPGAFITLQAQTAVAGLERRAAAAQR